MITNNGRTILRNYFTGLTAQIAGSMAIGVGTTAATLNDQNLVYEVIRVPIASTSPDTVNSRIIFKANLLPGQIKTIYEVALYSIYESTDESKTLNLLDPTTAIWTNGTKTATNARANAEALKIDYVANGTTNAELIDFSDDLSLFLDTDIVVVGFHSTGNLSTVRVRLGTDATNYFELTLSSPTVGYNIYRLARSNFTVTGTPSWETISYAAVRPSATAAGAGSIYFDGLRIERPSTENLLVARKVLDPAVVTDPDIINEVEYALEISFI